MPDAGQAALNPSRPFILRPVATSLLAVAIVLLGLFAYRLLPISALPEVDFPTIQVATPYPGASAQVVADTVTAPLEEQLGRMPGLAQMASTSSIGASTVTLRFDLGLPLDVAEQEVQAAINAVLPALPKGLAQPPVYHKVNPADVPVLTLALTSPTLPLRELRALADTRLLPRLSQVSGVGLVSVAGGQQPAIVVQADPARLAARGLTLADLRAAIASANSAQAQGVLQGPNQASTIALGTAMDSADAFKRLIVAQKDGAVLRLGDVADVTEGAQNAQVAAWDGLQPAILLRIQRQPGANVVRVADRVQRLLPALSATLPAAAQITTLSDRTQTVRAAVHDVQFELLIAIALVVLVIFLFLGSATATLIPAVVVPLALIGTFAVMYLAGFSINNLTLMALVIATGFMVDDAIVMIENIARHVEAGVAPLAAALQGAREIAFTVISLTLSLIAVLIPLLFMQGLVGRLFREFAITLAVAILISGVVSLTLTPMMCARLLKRGAPEREGRVARVSRRWNARVLTGYGRALEWVLARQGATLVAVVAMAAIAAALYLAVPRGLFPAQDTGALQGATRAAPTVSFAAMAERQQALTKVLLQDPAVANVASFVGVGDGNAAPNTGRLLIQLKPLSQRPRAPRVMARLAREVRQVDGITLHLQPVPDLTIEDQTAAGQYQFALTSPDAATLAQWAPRVVQRLQQDPLLQGATSDQESGGLQARVTLDRDLAARHGITPQAVGEALSTAFGDRPAAMLLGAPNQPQVILEARPGAASMRAALASVRIAGHAPEGKPGAALVPLTAIARVSEGAAPLTVTRVNAAPAATVSFNLAPGASLEGATQAVDRSATALDLPASMALRWQGAAQAFVSSLSGQPWLLLATLICVYIVLGVLYESFIHPLTILSTLPSAAIGALLALLAGGFELDVVSIIGIILLIGIVQKNAILIVDFALAAQREQGLSPRAAIVQASLLRFRPIVMTTLAAMLSAVPLMLATGMGAELRRPLGVAIFWGLLASQLLTLFTTPVIYLAFERLLRWLGWNSSHAAGAA